MIEPAAFVNFVSDRTLDDLASEFSARLFGGIPFVGRDEGIWDEIPAVRLSTRFLGFEVILGGKEGATGGYSFEVVVADSVSENASTERADLSEYVAYLVGTISVFKSFDGRSWDARILERFSPALNACFP